MGHKYNGPHNNRVLTQNSFVEFADNDARENFLKAAGSTKLVAFPEVKLKRGKTQLNSERDWALYKAKELLAAAAQGQTVALDRDLRKVTVNNVAAFEQQKGEPRGTFCGCFAHLTLP